MSTTSAQVTSGGVRLAGRVTGWSGDRLQALLRLSQRADDLIAFRIGPRLVHFVNDPQLVEQVLVSQAASFEKTSRMRKNLGVLVGNGLLTSENQFHKRQRRLVAPAFQHRRVSAYATTMAEYAERIQAEWADGMGIDLAHEMMRLTLWIAGKTLFDADVLNEADELGQALTVALRFANSRFLAPVALPLNWPTPQNRSARKAIARLNTTVFRMIAERRASGEDRGDLLSMLLAARDADDGSFMTDAQVRDEAMTLFLAGHETTANALAWSWHLLSLHAPIYDRLLAEVDSVLGGRTPQMADLERLPYTLQVLKEAMRLYPPAYVVSREASEFVQIGRYRLPPGSLLLLSPYTMHRRADLFADPERFDPERFTPEREQQLPRFAYFPFGGGPRVCIGNQFALLEGQIVLASLAQRVRFRRADRSDTASEPLITLRPRGALSMFVQRR